MANNIKSKQWLLVINTDTNKKAPNDYESLKGYLSVITNSNYFSFVSSIIHDKDILENGENKRIHSHSFIELHEKTTKKALLDTLSNMLDINITCLSLEPTNNDFLGIQYLTHKNDTSKHQYDYDLIITNDIDKLSKRYNQTYKTETDLTQEIFNCKTLTELIENTSLNFANSHRAIFNQIKQEQEINVKEIMLLNRELNQENIDIRKSYLDMMNDYKRLLDTIENALKENEKNLINFKHFIALFNCCVSTYEMFQKPKN